MPLFHKLTDRLQAKALVNSNLKARQHSGT